MAVAGDFVTELLTRMRDPQGSQHPRQVVRDLLDRCQVLVVRRAGFLIEEVPFPLLPTRQLYVVDPTVTLRLIDFFFNATAVRLTPIRWQMLIHEGVTTWWRATGEPAVWAPFGANFVLIHPAPLVPISLTVRRQRRPAALTADTVPIEVPDDTFPELLELVEALLLLRTRDPGAAAAITRLKSIPITPDMYLDEQVGPADTTSAPNG